MKKIIINVQKSLEDRFSEQWSQGYPDLIACHQAVVQFRAMKPMFVTKEQAEYLKSIGATLPQPPLRIYIGEDILELKEYFEAVELPAQILDNKTDFNREVVQRIRRYVGSSVDN